MASDEAVAIELNDVGVILSDAAGLSAPSPGIAFFDGERLLTGEAARSLWRTVPTQANDCFWDDLSQEPLSRPLGPALSTADLVHAQLSSLWRSRPGAPSEAIVSLPSDFDRERLGLLLGILQSVPVPVVGVVDSAVLCATAAPESIENVVHVDLRLHRCVITRVTKNGEWVRESVDAVEDCGWLSLLELWAGAIADRFIRTTRFDPLHAAAYEQRLHDLLPRCLSTLALEPEVKLEVGPTTAGHRIVVPRKELIQATSSRLGTLLSRIQHHVGDKEETLCQVTSRLRACPGFEALLREALSCQLDFLPEGFAAIHARLKVPWLRCLDGRVPFVTRMSNEGAVGPAPREATHGS